MGQSGRCGRNCITLLVTVVCYLCAISSRPVTALSPEHILLLQQYVLDGLGLSRLPDTTKMNISETEYLTKYESYLQSVRDNKRLRLQRDTSVSLQRFYSVNHFGEAPLVLNYKGSHEVFYFPVVSNNATVDQATLRLFLVGPIGISEVSFLTLRVHQLTAHSRLLLDSNSLYLKETSRWVEFDVTKAVSSWVSGQYRNLGLEVECDGCTASRVRLVTTQTGSSSFSPVLNILLTEREAYPRNPRAMLGEAVHYDDALGSDCRKGPNQGRCCRHSLEVVFKDVPGFEFILQPYKFNAGFCKGRCPPRYHPASQHALLQSLVAQMYHVPRPCCAPHTLADIEVLHLDETDPSALKVSTWKRMQVQRCACS